VPAFEPLTVFYEPAKLVMKRMTTPIIRTATASDQALITDVLVRAFIADPAARWTWPDAQQYRTHFASFVQAFGGKAFTHGSAQYIDGYAAAALWLPPSVHPDEEVMITLLQRTVSQEIQNNVFAVFEEMGRFHPNEPHWYLPLIGVDPSQQGKGFGSALMRHVLIQCDRDNTRAYLESTSPKSIPLYERLGFHLLGTIQIGASPPLFPMLREPGGRNG
jgi:ribosomal protein S18 acetylase RimI-like enzyme